MLFWVHKELENKNVKLLTKDEINNLLNDGWLPGKCPAHWITNGVVNKLLKEGLELPQGFRYGQSEEFKRKNSESGRLRWKNTSQERRLEIAKKVSEGTKNMWDNLSNDERDLREKHRLDTRNNWTKEEIEKHSLSMSIAAKKNRASITKEEYHERSVKATTTKKKNNSFNTSSYEELCYEALCNNFGKTDVIREYMNDSRYPFKSDFYIKSKDLFIELNIHPSHGKHRFNFSNKDDVDLAEALKNKNDKWSNMILYVWCNRDVEKFNTAIENKLNYIAIYPEDFDNFISKLKENKL